MIEFMVVDDDCLPAGHEWLQLDFPDGHTTVFLGRGGDVMQRCATITVRGTTFQTIPNADPFDWEWCRVRMCDGADRVIFNRDSLAYHLGYVRCDDEGTPVTPLRLVS